MKRKIKIIIGANYGDEGKGLATDYFCSPNPQKTLGILTNGTAQRGHTVTLEDERFHVFHHFSSGTLQGVPTYIGKEFTVNPLIYLEEYYSLKRNFGITPIVYLNPNCKIVTPFDMLANIKEKEKTGINNTCGCGYWKTLSRYTNHIEPLSVQKFTKLDFTQKLNCLYNIATYYSKQINDLNINKSNMIWNFAKDFETMMQSVILIDDEIVRDLRFEYLVFENGQGLFIGEQNNTANWDYCTPSNTGLVPAMDIIRNALFHHGISTIKNIEICYISRCYLTRHGAGELENENVNKIITTDLTNFTNPYQGSLRYGELNLKTLLERIERDYKTRYFYKESYIEKRFLKSLMFTHYNENTNQEIQDFISNDNDFYEIYLSDGKTRNSIKRV